MHKLLIIIAAVFALAACTPTQQSAAVGGGVGAVIGGVATGNVAGAAVGAVVGAAAGTVVATVANSNRCVYSDGRGGTYTDRCPAR
ncbi:hypothetical protein EMQ25_04170 [Arsenicitalea aurantiaca]|uniref:Glycine zipper domain-containing protein n=1 Tax=Arsenicitalea aurantiaca TaxID=1783274 RepID=A0A433XMD6_9HYPH|nr:hypothetical protein [Arsenicitalea aurantiaca]RUT35148.1 hypothetical protein EMQ25_04170 [Arsenicitalea aurantiaca]